MFPILWLNIDHKKFSSCFVFPHFPVNYFSLSVHPLSLSLSPLSVHLPPLFPLPFWSFLFLPNSKMIGGVPSTSRLVAEVLVFSAVVMDLDVWGFPECLWEPYWWFLGIHRRGLRAATGSTTVMVLGFSCSPPSPLSFFRPPSLLLCASINNSLYLRFPCSRSSFLPHFVLPFGFLLGWPDLGLTARWSLRGRFW